MNAGIRSAIFQDIEKNKPVFLNELDIGLMENDLWHLRQPLMYYSGLLRVLIIVPEGFLTDLASVPRLPLIYDMWGARAHREAVVHDAMYCVDFPIKVSYSQANKVFLEAMASRGVSWHIRWPMYLAVCAFGWTQWHKRTMKGGYD